MTRATATPSHSIREFEAGYESEGRLRGFRSGCGFVTATWGVACPRCGASDLTEVELGRDGRIAAVSVQNVPGEEFLDDAPYAYVLVDLDGGGRIAGWIAGVREDASVRNGDRVRFRPGYRGGVQFERLPEG